MSNLFRIGQEVRIGDNKGVIISKPLEGTKNSIVYKVKEYVGKDVVFRVLFEEEIYMILQEQVRRKINKNVFLAQKLNINRKEKL